MITTSKQTSFSYLRRILVLPVAMLVCALFSFTMARAQNKPDSASMREQKLKDEQAEYIKQSPEEKKTHEVVQEEISKHKAEAIMNNLPDVLYLINGVESTKEQISKLPPASIKSITCLCIGKNRNEYKEQLQSPWGKELTARFGDRVKNGVIELTTK